MDIPRPPLPPSPPSAKPPLLPVKTEKPELRLPEPGLVERLQELEEPMKRRLLIAGSVVAMIAVVYVWIGYFNSIVVGNSVQFANQSSAAQAGTTQAPAQGASLAPQGQQSSPQPSAPGFWQELGSGFVSLYYDAVSGAKSLGSMIQAPKQYKING